MDQRGWQTAAWGIAAVVAVLLGLRLLGGGGGESPPPVSIGGDRPAGREQRPALFVHVAGAVRRPGLYRVAVGGRVAAAIERAGGPTRAARLDGINLAAEVADGQQIVVPARGAAIGGGGGDLDQQAPISLGTATVEQLEELDGIGPTLAERIVDAREASGGFASLDELDDVDGIGATRLEALKEALAP